MNINQYNEVTVNISPQFINHKIAHLSQGMLLFIIILIGVSNMNVKFNSSVFYK